MIKILKNERGLTLVEVLVSATIITTFITALVGVFGLYMRESSSRVLEVKAIYLAEESVEMIKFLRSESWSENILNFSTTSETIDSHERVVTLSDVYRNNDGDIVETGGTLDPGTKEVEVSVSWVGASGTSTRSIVTYITNLYDN